MSGNSLQRSSPKQPHQVALTAMSLPIERRPEGWSVRRFLRIGSLVAAVLVAGLFAVLIKIGLEPGTARMAVLGTVLVIFAWLALPAVAWLVAFHSPPREFLLFPPTLPPEPFGSMATPATGRPVLNLDRPPRPSASQGR